MPWTYRETIQFGLLMLCVPLQFFMSGYFRTYTSVDGRSEALLEILKELDNVKISWLEIESWKVRWQQFLTWFLEADNDPVEVSKAVEVLKYREDNFGLTEIVHDVRSSNQKFRVGQVVANVDANVTGVVINWRLMTLDENYIIPVYRVLVDETDGIRVFKEDVVIIESLENTLDLLKSTKISHPKLSELFVGFDGTQYIPLSWLKKMFPKD